jgi:hypothetical protein
VGAGAACAAGLPPNSIAAASAPAPTAAAAAPRIDCTVFMFVLLPEPQFPDMLETLRINCWANNRNDPIRAVNWITVDTTQLLCIFTFAYLMSAFMQTLIYAIQDIRKY